MGKAQNQLAILVSSVTRRTGGGHTLVVSPETGRVIDDAFLGVLVDDAGVTAPQVSVHKRRLHFPSVALQRPEKPGNDGLEERREDGIELGIGPGPLFSKPQNMAETVGEEVLPAARPRVVLGQVAIVSHAPEAELTVRRLV